MEAVSTTAIWPATMLNRSDVELNSAGGQGGGIFEETGGVTLDRSLVSGNMPTNCAPSAAVPGCVGLDGAVSCRNGAGHDGRPSFQQLSQQALRPRQPAWAVEVTGGPAQCQRTCADVRGTRG